MFDTASVCRVLSISAGLFLSLSPAIAADPPPLVGHSETAAIDEALRCLKMTQDDLRYKKDYSDAPYRLQQVQRVLEQPLELPVHANDVVGSLQRADSLTSLTLFCVSELERDARKFLWIGPILRTIEGFDAQAVPSSFQAVVSDLVSSIAFADELLEGAFAEVSRADRERAAARYSAANLQLDTDRDEIRVLGKVGFNVALINGMIARDEALETEDDEYARDLLPVFGRMRIDGMLNAAWILAMRIDKTVELFDKGEWATAIAADAKVRIDTRSGPIFLGGSGPTHYTEDALLIIDLGGDDIYECAAAAANGLAGRPISLLIDLGGNDTYRRGTLSQGAGVFGIGILVDCAGADIYEARHLSQGTGMFGVGILADYGGNDLYTGDIHAQGAGVFGVGVLWDRGGDDRCFARQSSQGFGYTGGLGVVLDEKGNDTYYAGGKYADHERLPEHFLSCSQGFGYGMRPDACGGTGILCDLAGNDVYTTDIYGQGVSYFYSLGMLLDVQGHDLYRCHQYGQGSGIHLSAGILADWQGDDQYVGHGIVQGSAHDWSVGMLFDRQGNDQYIADSTAQGSALYNSTALLVDSAGADVYASPLGANTQAAGHDGSVREYGTIAMLLDLDGKDTYSNGPRDNFVALKPLHGCALDAAESSVEGRESRAREDADKARTAAAVADSPSRGATNHESRVTNHGPPFASSPTELSNPRNDGERAWLKLIRQATQYPDTLKRAKEKTIAFEALKREGAAVVPFWLRQLDHETVAVRVRLDDFMEIVGGTNAAPALIDALQIPNEHVRRHACYYAGKLKAPAAAELVRAQLVHTKVRPVALWALGELNDPSAFTDALHYLNDPQENVRLRAAGYLGKLADPRGAPSLIVSLNDPLWDVRYAALAALIKIGKPALKPIRVTLPEATERARPYLIEALGRVGDPRDANLLRPYLRTDNWLDRGTAVSAIAALKPSWAQTELRRLRAAEQNLFVRSRLSEATEP